MNITEAVNKLVKRYTELTREQAIELAIVRQVNATQADIARQADMASSVLVRQCCACWDWLGVKDAMGSRGGESHDYCACCLDNLIKTV